MQTIVLGSTSIFRKAILEKLNLPFECAKPDIDESAFEGESPKALVERLAVEKAKKVAIDYKDAFVIGSDQVAVCDGQILGKPHNFENGVKQLSLFNGKAVEFLTGLCVINTTTGEHFSLVEPFMVHFKENSQEDIANYLHAEQPYKCAGSFKSEGLGICLFEKLAGDDPNTLIGLPLIRLVELFKKHGLNVLANQP